jgi:hypothetical protein
MKTATIPSLRVDPNLRRDAEEMLKEGESLSSFVEQSLREGIERRRLHGEFITRGLLSRDNAKESGRYVDSDVVVSRLESMLKKAKATKKRQ